MTLENSSKFIDLYKHLREQGGLGQLAVLTAAGTGATMTDIADAMGCSTAAITGIVDRLVKAQFARRQDVPGDRRKYILSITEKGERHLRQALDAVECPKVKPATKS